MALSPADFYAYSRATGVPVPEDPYEKAELAPQVLEFRRNQLKAPQQEQNIGQALGAAALGTAAAIGAGLAARRFFGRGTQAAKPATRPTSRGITVGDLKAYAEGPVSKVAAPRAAVQPLADPWGQDTVPPSIKPAATVNPSVPAPGTTTNALEIDPTDRLIAEFQEMKAAETQAKETKSQELRQRMGKAYGQQLYKTADQLLDELQGESLTTLQQASAPAQAAQVNNAFESGTNQVIDRIEQIERRDPQYDPTQNALLNEMADADEAWMRQQEPPQGALDLEVEETRPLTSQDFADIAKDEMIARRQAVEARGLRPGTARFERALAEGWASKPNLLPGSEKFNQNISLPTTIRSAVEAASADPLDPLGELKERSLINIGPDAQIEQTAAGTAIRGASSVAHEALPKLSLRQLLGGEMGPDIPGSQRVRGAMAEDIPESQLSKQEITYGFLNQAAEPEIPGGSAGIGVYGVDPNYVPGAMSKATGEYSAAASRKPTYVPKWLEKREATPFAGLGAQHLQNALAKANKGGTRAITNEINRRQANRVGVGISEMFRRARIEGRDPQEFLNNAMAQQSISAVGDFSPIKKTASSALTGSSSLNTVRGRKATPAEQAFARYTRVVGNPYQM